MNRVMDRMNRMMRTAGIIATAGALGLTAPAFANCVLEGPYEIVSCPGVTAGPDPQFFAPEPGGALPPTVPAGPGQVTVTWWQIGFGNELQDDPSLGVTYVAQDVGAGFWSGPTATAARFTGNDLGPGNYSIAGYTDLVDAEPFGGPPRSVCFGSSANWGNAGVDNCCDNNRNYYGPGGLGSVSDQALNPYYSAPPDPYANKLMMDSPVGILLREPTNTRFAAAFVRNLPRGGNPDDLTSGFWDLNLISNGEPNPTQGGAPNVVPWQLIPQPDIQATFQNPGDPLNSPRILNVTWESIRLVHDGSMQASLWYPPLALSAQPLGYDRFNNPVTGVGVLDQPELASYQLQSKPVAVGGDCDPNSPWVPLGSIVPHAGDMAPHSANGLVVPPNTCVRLQTHLGRVPAKTFVIPTTNTLRNARRLEAQRGLFGDVGYDLFSAEKKVGGALVSQTANLIAIERSQSVVKVRFETTIELDITAIDIVGLDQKGGRRVLMTVDPQQGTTGVGATYSVDVPHSLFKDTKQVQIVLQPTGEGSNLLEVR